MCFCTISGNISANILLDLFYSRTSKPVLITEEGGGGKNLVDQVFFVQEKREQKVLCKLNAYNNSLEFNSLQSF